MKKIALLLPLAAALLMAGCASAPLPGAVDNCEICKLGVAIFSGKVSISDERETGIVVGGSTVADALLDFQQPGLSGLLRLAVEEKQIRKSGYVLKVNLQGRSRTVEVVCQGKLAEACEDIPPNTPAVLYLTQVPISAQGSGPLYLLRRLNAD